MRLPLLPIWFAVISISLELNADGRGDEVEGVDYFNFKDEPRPTIDYITEMPKKEDLTPEGNSWYVLLSGIGRYSTTPMREMPLKERCEEMCHLKATKECKHVVEERHRACSIDKSAGDCHGDTCLKSAKNNCFLSCIDGNTNDTCSVCTEALLINNNLAYSSESDVSRAYQILKSRGVPDERIIVFMDDTMGPWFNDTLINEENGPNVYTGVPKDYTGENWNKNNLYNVLRGMEMDVGSGKTLEAGPEDTIFIYLLSHGDLGLALFGNIGSDINNPIENVIHADELMEVFESMYENKRYKSMVLYWNTCFSGSMFKNFLREDRNIYAVSSQVSYDYAMACDVSVQHKTDLYPFVDTQSFPICSLFGQAWLSTLENENINGANNMEKLFAQTTIATIKASNYTQLPMEWGDISITKLPVSELFAEKGTESSSLSIKSSIDFSTAIHESPVSMCQSYENSLQNQLEMASSISEYDHIKSKLHTLREVDEYHRNKVEDIIEATIRFEIEREDNFVDKHQLLPWTNAYNEMTSDSFKHCFRPMRSFYAKKCSTNHDTNKEWCSTMSATRNFLSLCQAKVSMVSFYKALSSICV